MPKLDWTQRESVRAGLRSGVRRLLAKYGYPPDLAEDATQARAATSRAVDRELGIVIRSGTTRAPANPQPCYPDRARAGSRPRRAALAMPPTQRAPAPRVEERADHLTRSGMVLSARAILAPEPRASSDLRSANSLEHQVLDRPGNIRYSQHMDASLTFGETIRRLRRQKKWSLGTLTEQTGLSYSYLSRVENDSASPQPDAVARLAEALDGDVRELLELADCLPGVILDRIARRWDGASPGALNRSAGEAICLRRARSGRWLRTWQLSTVSRRPKPTVSRMQ